MVMIKLSSIVKYDIYMYVTTCSNLRVSSITFMKKNREDYEVSSVINLYLRRVVTRYIDYEYVFRYREYEEFD